MAANTEVLLHKDVYLMEVMLTKQVFLQVPDGDLSPVAIGQRSVHMPTLPEVGTTIDIGGHRSIVEKVGPYEVQTGWYHALLEPTCVTDPNERYAVLEELRDQNFDVSWSLQWPAAPRSLAPPQAGTQGV